eukprot:9812384-Alexandrium_andersonii.AAC.1
MEASFTQAGAPCLSSGESELRGIAHAAKEAMGIENLCKDMGLATGTPTVWTDSSAAKSAAA